MNGANGSKKRMAPQCLDAKTGLIPRLRFPEFQDAREWSGTALGTVAENLDNRRIPITSSERRAGDVPYYGASGVVDYVDGFIFDEDLLCVSEDGANLVARTYPIAFPISGKTWVNNHAHVLRFTHACTQKFVDVYLNWIKLDDFITGMAQPKLNKAMLDRIPIPFPSLAEQQKIADCLSSLDELIAAQARKVETLKTHKKGLMQQLFPRDGETQPRWRFPEFRDAGEWEGYALGVLIDIASGQVDPKTPPYSSSPQIGSENIESYSGNLVNVKSASEKGVTSGNYAFDEHHILYSKIRPALNKVAAPAFKGICSADIYPIRPSDNRLVRMYLFYLLLCQGFLDYAIRNSERGKIPKINREALINFNAMIPIPHEQKRIADCLTSLDTLITAET
jgi:type I restriction enzyme S subunit